MFHHRDWVSSGDETGAAASFEDGDTGGSFDSSRDGTEDKLSDDRSVPPTEGVETDSANHQRAIAAAEATNLS